MRSSDSVIASRRSLPIAMSRSMRVSSSEKGPPLFSATRASAASRPRPASTQVVIRSMASGRALMTSFCRALTLPFSHMRGNTKPIAVNMTMKMSLWISRLPGSTTKKRTPRPPNVAKMTAQNVDEGLEGHRVAGHDKLLLDVGEDRRR